MKLEEEEIKKMDELNLRWFLEQVSLGNLARAYLFLSDSLKQVWDYLFKFGEEEEEKQEAEKKKR